MRKKTQYIVVNEIYKTIYCGYPQKRAWNIFETEVGKNDCKKARTFMKRKTLMLRLGAMAMTAAMPWKTVQSCSRCRPLIS